MDNLKKHISKFVEISDEEFEEIKLFFDVKNVSKKENLLNEGQICLNNFFVSSGLIRKFYLNEKGVEQTTEFAIESWWMTENISFEHKVPSEFSIQAVEKSSVIFITRENQEKLLRTFPKMERYFRFIYQRAYAAAQMRVKHLYSLSKEDFYLRVVEKYPEFVQRVPQYLLASFLGFTPEYLSEIRKRRVS